VAAFFLRVHAAEIAQLGAHFGLKPVAVVGISLGLLAGVCGSISNWLGGVIADRWALRDLRAFGAVPAIAAFVSVPFACAALFADSAVVALACLVPSYLLNGLWFGPGLACIQGVVPREFRATASSLALFVINIAGFGFGGLAIGALSDAFQHGLDMSPAEGVRCALIGSSLVGLLAGVLFWRARHYIRAEVVT
jgi:predicted MFS family arabinose efflux permease